MSACLTEAELAALATAHHLTCESCRSKLLNPATHVTAPPSLEDTIEVRAPVDDVPASVGRYVVVEKNGVQELLGRGGYGKVLLTRDSAVGRDVALKCLRSRVVSSPKRAQAEARLLREARVVGQLEHPAIVPLYDVGRSETGRLFYTMRRIRGRTLAEAVASAGDFTARLRLLPHVLTACHAIAYAHSRGVIHRDLKPQNVMVDRFGQTAVIDWGLASTAGAEVDEPSAPETSNVLRLVGDGQTISDGKGRLGTPAYMSPEQLTGVRGLIDEKSDVWGLGAILFEVLTGKSPRANGPLSRPPDPVRTLVPDCPKDLAALCDKALAESRDERYPSAEALAEDLDAWLHGREVKAHVYRPRELIKRFVTEHRIALSVGAISLATLVVLMTGAFLRVRDERNRAREFGLAMLNDVLPRMTSLGDAAFLARFTGRVQEWLDATGSGADDPAVARAWLHLSIGAEAAGDEPTALRYAQRCLDLTRELDPHHRYAFEQGCGVLFDDNGGLPDADAIVAHIETLWSQPPPPGMENDVATLESRQQVSARRTYHANLKGKSLLEGEAGRDTVTLARQWRRVAPDEPMAISALSDALSNAAVAAINQHDSALALSLASESVEEARALLKATRNVQSIARLSDALLVDVTTRHWFGRDDAALQPLYEEARAVYGAEQLMTPEPTLARIGLLQLELETAHLEALPALLDRLEPHKLSSNAFGLWLYATVASGRGPQVLTDEAVLARHPGFLDTSLGFALAAADAGDFQRAAKWAREASGYGTGSSWAIGGMDRWARTRQGPAAPAIQRFATGMAASLRQANNEQTKTALLELATALEELQP